MDETITVIVPIYNIEKDYLIRCCECLTNQTVKQFRVLLIDDGSTNGCSEICDLYAERDGRFSTIHQENGGVSSARNNGITGSKTKWVTFIDPDDWVELNYIETLQELALGHPEDEVIMFDYFQEYVGKSIANHLFESDRSLSLEELDILRKAPFHRLVINGKNVSYEHSTVWNKLYRLSLLQENNLLFDLKARKGQDIIFNAELYLTANRISYCRKCLYHYVYYSSSITNRYNPRVNEFNEVAFAKYEELITQFNLGVEYTQLFYARVVTRIYSSLRLFYFNPNNRSSLVSVNREIAELINRQPYKDSLKHVDYNQLTKGQQIFVSCLKKRLFLTLRILVKGKLFLSKAKGVRYYS